MAEKPSLHRASLVLALFCAALAGGCDDTSPGAALETAGAALSRNDSGGFLAQIDLPLYARHEFQNMRRSNGVLSTVDAFSDLLGIRDEVGGLLNDVLDLESALLREFTDGVADGSIARQCSRADAVNCPWTGEGLSRADVRELTPDSAVAKVVTPAGKTSWLSLRRIGGSWKITGRALLEKDAAAFAADSGAQRPAPPPRPAAPARPRGQEPDGAVRI